MYLHIFSPSGSQTWQYSDGDPPNRGVKCRWGRRFWATIWLHRVLSMLRPARCYQHGAAGQWQVVTPRRSLLWRDDDDRIFMTRSLNVTPKTTFSPTVRSDKSAAYNKKLCCAQRFVRTIETTTDKLEASRGLFATAELFV